MKENGYKLHVRNLNENIRRVSVDLNLPVTDSILHKELSSSSDMVVIPRSEIRIFIPNSIMKIKILSNDGHLPVSESSLEASQSGTDDIPRNEIRRIISDTIMNIKTLFMEPKIPVTEPISEAGPSDADDIPRSEIRRIFSNTIMNIKSLLMDPSLPVTEPISETSPSGIDDIPRSEIRRINSNTIMNMNSVTIEPNLPVTVLLSHNQEACPSSSHALSRSEIKIIPNSIMDVKAVTDSISHRQEACSSGTNTLPQREIRRSSFGKMKSVVIDPNLPVTKICSGFTIPSFSNSAIKTEAAGVKTSTAKYSAAKLLTKNESVVLTNSDRIPSRTYVVRGPPRRIAEVSRGGRPRCSNVRPTSERHLRRPSRPSIAAIKSRTISTSDAIWV